jgi:hypothetical protein
LPEKKKKDQNKEYGLYTLQELKAKNGTEVPFL